MRHLKHRHQLGVKKEHRMALMANLATQLIIHTRIKTTLAKAKALRPFVEKIVTLSVHARKATPARAVYLRRRAVARLRNKQAVKVLFDERAESFLDRPGGYTRIYKIGQRRGSAAEMALIEFVEAVEAAPATPEKTESEAPPKDSASS